VLDVVALGWVTCMDHQSRSVGSNGLFIERRNMPVLEPRVCLCVCVCVCASVQLMLFGLHERPTGCTVLMSISTCPVLSIVAHTLAAEEVCAFNVVGG
jgi:hypothetical protein